MEQAASLRLATRMASLEPSATLAMAARAGAMKAEGIDVIDLSVGEPDFPTPPHICQAGAAAIAAAVIVHQHDPSETTLRDTVWRLLGSKLQGGDPGADPLPEMGQAMRELGVEDADQKLVVLLEGLLA